MVLNIQLILIFQKKEFLREQLQELEKILQMENQLKQKLLLMMKLLKHQERYVQN